MAGRVPRLPLSQPARWALSRACPETHPARRALMVPAHYPRPQLPVVPASAFPATRDPTEVPASVRPSRRDAVEPGCWAIPDCADGFSHVSCLRVWTCAACAATACPVGQYKASTGSGACVFCPDFATTSSPGSTSPSDCICQPGYNGTPGTGCTCTFFLSFSLSPYRLFLTYALPPAAHPQCNLARPTHSACRALRAVPAV